MLLFLLITLKKGAPSDRNGVLAIPVNNHEPVRGTTKEVRFVRPMPGSFIDEFRQSIRSIDWPLMIEGLSSSGMVDTFQEMAKELFDLHFPPKKISITQFDKPWITVELKAIRRRRQRIYRKEGRSSSYLKVKMEFEKKLEAEVDKYVDKIKEEVANGK